jgi:hypothetical protein
MLRNVATQHFFSALDLATCISFWLNTSWTSPGTIGRARGGMNVEIPKGCDETKKPTTLEHKASDRGRWEGYNSATITGGHLVFYVCKRFRASRKQENNHIPGTVSVPVRCPLIRARRFMFYPIRIE